jgi:sirohydrochlorin ferrochelatase
VTPALILTAHGSADPRSAATTHAVARLIRRTRPGLDVRVAFCEQIEPNLRDVLAGLTDGGGDEPLVRRAEAVVAPLLLASAYHARVDIPAMISEAGISVRQAHVLGEDERLLAVLRTRLASVGVSRLDGELGVVVAAVGSSHTDANARTATLARTLAEGTRWAGVEVAHATRPDPSIADAVARLRERGASRLVVAPWFLAPGRITDRVADIARTAGIAMAAPLGAHPLVAATVLDRYEQALAGRAAA